MIRLKDYREFWERVKESTPALTGVMPVTVDEDMARKIKALPQGSITLFWLPPNVEGSGVNVDNFQDINHCIAFIMEKYDPSRKETMTVLEETQEIIERIQAVVLGMSGSCQDPFILDSNDYKITILPETKFFASFAGWSIGFTALK